LSLVITVLIQGWSFSLLKILHFCIKEIVRNIPILGDEIITSLNTKSFLISQRLHAKQPNTMINILLVLLVPSINFSIKSSIQVGSPDQSKISFELHLKVDIGASESELALMDSTTSCLDGNGIQNWNHKGILCGIHLTCPHPPAKPSPAPPYCVALGSSSSSHPQPPRPLLHATHLSPYRPPLCRPPPSAAPRAPSTFLCFGPANAPRGYL
jgi:hypothetical protein